MPENRTRPGTGFIISMALFGVLTVAAVLTSIALTTLDTERRSFPNTVITDVDTLAATSGIILAVLVCSYAVQTRLLDRIDMHANRIADGVQMVSEDVELLRDDTGQIPRLANAVVDAPEIVVIRVPDRIFESVDRESAAHVLAEAETRMGQDAEDTTPPLPAGMAAQIWEMSEKATERRLRAAGRDAS